MPPSSEATEPRRLEMIDDVCRHCGATSRRRHPGGVVRGSNWRCLEPDCGRWQIRTYEKEDGA